MRSLLLACLVVVGCASAGSERQNPGDDVDASITDGKAIDAAPDAPEPCTEIMTELLANGNLDGTPLGTGWTEIRGAGLELVTPDGGTAAGGINEQTAPNQVWLGGANAITDVVYQNVTIPARTRLINFSGFYEVRSTDNAANNDTGGIFWVTPADAPIATIKALDNNQKTTTFTTINFGLTNAPMYSGMTMRLKMSLTNTTTPATSFFMDTLSVKATHCMP